MGWAGAEDDIGGWNSEGDEACAGGERCGHTQDEGRPDEEGAAEVFNSDGVPIVEELLVGR